MIKRALFLVEVPFGKRDFDRFGIELLLQNGFQVDIWDLSYILRPQLSQNQNPADVFSYDRLTVFYDKHELYSKLSSLSKKDFVVNLVGYNYLSLGIYKALSTSNVNYAIFMSNALPSLRKSGFSNFLKKCKNLYPPTPKRIWQPIFLRLPFQWFGIKPAALILAGGAKCFMGKYPATRETEILSCHALDYDLYLKESHAPVVECPIAVFLDQYLPFNRDYALSNIKPFISADRYYPLLNKFFRLVKNNLGFKVVIAAHPSSHYEENSNYFNGYECIKGKTIQLIKDSQLVLAHDSTALNFANLFYKPVLFLTSSELDCTFEGAYIREMSKWFGKKPISMDDNIEIDWKEELKVNRDVYNHYRQSYIKEEGSEELPFWQIVANRLKKGFCDEK